MNLNYRFDFLRWTKPALSLSGALVLLSVLLVFSPLVPWAGFHPGLNPGLDFTGGTQLRVQFTQSVSTAQVRAALGQARVSEYDLTKSAIHEFHDLPRVKTITMKLTDEDDIDEVVRALSEAFPGVEVLSRDVVGGQISKELVQSGWQSTILVLVVMLLYISWRFQFRYAVGAVAALIHDVLIALGVFALFRVEINLPVIAAFLTIVGYSINDTIVIFDRVRENLAAQRRKDPYHVINLSLNQSLRRTIHTSLTTFMPVIVLTLFGGSVLFAFSLALLLGVVVGTYSSIFVASTIIYLWGRKVKATA